MIVVIINIESRSDKMEKGKRRSAFTMVVILFLIVLLIGVSYAVVTFVLRGDKENIVKSGNLVMDLTETGSEINLENAVPLKDATGMTTDYYQFTLTNTGNIAAHYRVFLKENQALYNEHGDHGKIFPDDKLKIALLKEGESTPTYLLYHRQDLLVGVLEPGESITYQVRIWIDYHAGNEVQGNHFHANLAVEAIQEVEKPDGNFRNSNILNVYQYDPTTCLTGEEATCQELSDTPFSYTPGTIVKYRVNNSLVFYFYVVRDDGNVLTMQQRENTIDPERWNATVTAGPLVVLPALETATASWTNVLDQTHTMGTTVFQDNAFTSCDPNSLVCTTNGYTLPERTGKARMITAQEIVELGCGMNNVSSCPAWMTNYVESEPDLPLDPDEPGDPSDPGDPLSDTRQVSIDAGLGYWTMSTFRDQSAFAIYYDRGLSIAAPTSSRFGARAVVTVSKYAY